MNYHDSVAQADQKMHASIKQLQLWKVAATPINYAVSYGYVSKNSTALIDVIDEQVSSGKKLDNFFFEEVHRNHILKQSALSGELIDDIDHVLVDVKKSSQKSISFTKRVVNQLDNSIVNLKSTNKQKVFQAIKEIRQATQLFTSEQLKLAEQLLVSQKSADALRTQLDDVKKEIYLDPLTRLYNRKAMAKHLDVWLSNDSNKQIAAIIINVDHLAKVNEQFGFLLGDVLLTKVASKINSYVGESGLPVRTAGDEFLILLPDIERNIAGEIAEKIRQGVEKLKFVSSKSGNSLPKLTVSIGVNDYNVATNSNAILTQTRKLINNIANQATNYVNIAGT